MRNNVWKMWKHVVLFLAVTVLVTAGITVTAKAGGPSFTNPQPTAVGQREQMSFDASGAPQFYAFTTDGLPGWYSINFGNSGGEGKYLDVYATPDESTPVLLDWYQGNGNSTRLLTLTPNKTYYIMVVPYRQRVGGIAHFTITKISDDYYNELSAATPIALGQTVEGKIEVDDKAECDTFCFTTTDNNSYYEMAISCTGNNSVYAEIYHGPDMSYDKYEVSASPADTRSIVYRLEPGKAYYVRIDGDNWWDEQTSYKFVVREIRDDAGDDFAQATKLSNGKTLSKTIQVEADTDFFKFKTNKKQNYYLFSFKNKSKSSMYVTIYDNNDIASAINEVKGAYVSSASTKNIWLRLKKNRTYYVKVTGYDNCSYNVQFKDLKSFVKKTAPTGFKAKGYWSYAYLNWTNKYQNARYEIYRSTSPNSGFKKIKTTKKNTSYYYDNRVKRRTTYYYKIKYYVSENDKVCSAKWSKVKKVRIK